MALRTLSLDVGGRDYELNDDTTSDACNDESDDRDQPFIDGPDLDVFCPLLDGARRIEYLGLGAQNRKARSVRRGSYAAA